MDSSTAVRADEQPFCGAVAGSQPLDGRGAGAVATGCSGAVTTGCAEIAATGAVAASLGPLCSVSLAVRGAARQSHDCDCTTSDSNTTPASLPTIRHGIARVVSSPFCLDTAYSLVVDEEVTESYLVESPFISLSYLEGGFSLRAAPDAVVTYSVPAGGTYVEIFTTIEMLPNEIVVRTSLIDTMAKAELKISTLFQKDAVLERTQWNTKIAAKIDPSTCESYDETMAYFRANELEISARYFSSGARRLTDLSELLDVLDETEVLVTPVVTETFAPTLAPSGSVAPSFMPTLTSAPSSTPAPSQAPTTLVCTQSDECPEGFVCCANDPTNRRSLLFGSVYGYWKVSC
ncbi:hypothetical protein M885DRAFT_572837 [Pelagophyceae sp. CCMP2097]|nr:hypothetical protein M885DRAFT_572837 [Pelagophyceae sp. CCMP2097]